MDEHVDPGTPSPEQQAAIQAERRQRAFSVQDLLVLEKSRSWLNELLVIAHPKGFHGRRPKAESLRSSIRAILKTLSEFEA